MRALWQTLFWLALTVWVGAIVFLSFVVAPTVFRTLSPEDAGRVMGALFPPYYALGSVAGVVGLTAALGVRRGATERDGRRGWSAVAVLVAGMLAATVYAGGVVQPRARALRPALHTTPVDPAARGEFDRLHRRAVWLNGLVLLAGVASVAVAASRPRAEPA